MLVKLADSGLSSSNPTHVTNAISEEGNGKPSHQIHCPRKLRALSPASATLEIECATQFLYSTIFFVQKDLELAMQRTNTSCDNKCGSRYNPGFCNSKNTNCKFVFLSSTEKCKHNFVPLKISSLLAKTRPRNLYPDVIDLFQPLADASYFDECWRKVLQPDKKACFFSCMNYQSFIQRNICSCF